jgi:alpha-beta hydrolase superfamily lysophospholipase
LIRERLQGYLPERLQAWKRLAREMPPAERLGVTTRDGHRLALWRVRPTGASRGAVLLLHGLSANRFAFHWPGRSIADYLAGEGFDAYVGELRGAGASAPGLTTWSFHDYLEHDVPALLDAVRETSGQARVHFVGHSMGGILMMCHGILTGGEGLLTGTALGSALDYGVGGSGFGPVLKLRPVLDKLTSVPWGAAMQAIAPLLARLPDPLAGFNFHPDNAEAALVRAVYANAFTAIPTALLGSLATTFEPGGLKSRAGESFLARAGAFGAPLMLVAASDDRQCPLPALEATALATRAKVLRFGAPYGHRAEYGHFDLLLGRHAPAEVWPALAQWLHEPRP